MNFRKIFPIILITAFFFSCKKDEDVSKPILGLEGDTWATTELDNWLRTNFTTPFNIEVKYRWDASELELDKTIVPVKTEMVRPTMNVIKKAWIDPYVAEAGLTFMKTYIPKQFVLVGSPAYDVFGARNVGRAEGGVKVTLLELNNFDTSLRADVNPADGNSVEAKLEIINHEFGHILSQHKKYPTAFQLITPSGYTSDWYNTTIEQANNKGFITRYAQSNPEDDFVEMIAIMLGKGRNEFYNGIVAPLNDTAQAALLKKEALVVAYFKDAWNIDFYSLQQRTQDALDAMTGIPSIYNYLGFNKSHTTVIINPAKQPATPPGFLQIYNSAKAGVASFGLSLDSAAFIFTSATRASLILYMSDGSDLYEAEYVYSVAKDANNVNTFTYLGADGNGNILKSAVSSLVDYFSNNTFKIDWFTRKYPWQANFTPQQTANANFMGIMTR